MTDLVPIHFPSSGSGATPTYNNINFILRKGTLDFYGGKTENQTMLDVVPFYSSEGDNTDGGRVTWSSVNGALDVDFDFIGDLEQPITIQGRVVVVVPLLHHLTTGTATVATTINAYLRTWDGTTETTIASDSATVSSQSFTGNATRGAAWSLSFDVSNKTKIKKGETIRLTITTSAPGANKQIGLCHDPQARDATEQGSSSPGGTLSQPDTTALTLSIPTVLEI